MSESPERQPQSVYLRRRAVALGGAVVALLLVVWGVGALIGEDPPPTKGAADARVLTPSNPPSSPPATLPSTPPSSSTSQPAPTTPTSPTTMAKPTTTTSTPPPGPPKPCTSAALRITAQIGAPSYRVGQHPQFTIVIANAGKVACTRDVGRKLRELVVTSADGKKHVWSSNDCYFLNPPGEVHTLRPGQRLSYGLNWAGRTSAAGCPVQRQTVPAGRYRVIAKLGPVTSKPVPFRLTS